MPKLEPSLSLSSFSSSSSDTGFCETESTLGFHEQNKFKYLFKFILTQCLSVLVCIDGDMLVMTEQEKSLQCQ